MAIRVVRLGTARLPQEGLRIGTVRRPPRGVAKTSYALRDYYDVWLPNLSPSPELMKTGKAVATDADWKIFVRKFRTEMMTPENKRILELLAALSQNTNFSIGCYCADESRCHRSVLRVLLLEHGARIESEK